VVADCGWYGRRLVWGNEKTPTRIATAGLYLLDVFLFYLDPTRNDTDDIVVYRFGELIDRIRRWSKA